MKWLNMSVIMGRGSNLYSKFRLNSNQIKRNIIKILQLHHYIQLSTFPLFTLTHFSYILHW